MTNIKKSGLDAVSIIALLTFLVGAVIAFLSTTVLANFGAAVYTVNLVVLPFLHEFAALLTAILMTDHTVSAFTVQIGPMKVNEGTDAIRAPGLDPIELLVLPWVLVLPVSLPILTFVDMLCDIIGGMTVCAWTLDIPPVMLLSIMEDEISVQHFLVGISKTPLFVFLIAAIGCLEGFKVSGNTQSVGEHTAASMAYPILVAVLPDALVMLFFMEMGW